MDFSGIFGFLDPLGISSDAPLANFVHLLEHGFSDTSKPTSLTLPKEIELAQMDFTNALNNSFDNVCEKAKDTPLLEFKDGLKSFYGVIGTKLELVVKYFVLAVLFLPFENNSLDKDEFTYAMSELLSMLMDARALATMDQLQAIDSHVVLFQSSVAEFKSMIDLLPTASSVVNILERSKEVAAAEQATAVVKSKTVDLFRKINDVMIHL